MFSSIKTTLEMIKWEHSVFALPFAMCGAMLAAGGLPTMAQLGWIILCMISARSAAMAFNRLADAQIDAANPRTATRAIPAGSLSQKFGIQAYEIARVELGSKLGEGRGCRDYGLQRSKVIWIIGAVQSGDAHYASQTPVYKAMKEPQWAS